MESYFLGAPTGFAEACISINSLASSDAALLRRIASGDDVPATLNNGQSILSVIEYIKSAIVKFSVDARALALCLSRFSDLSKAAMEIFIPVLFAEKADISKDLLSISEKDTLLGLDWSIVSNAQSSVSASMGSPFVLLHLRIRGSDGVVRIDTIEASFSQVKQLELVLKEASLSLDRA